MAQAEPPVSRCGRCRHARKQRGGSVERVNGSWRREFRECWDLRRDDLRSLNLLVS